LKLLDFSVLYIRLEINFPATLHLNFSHSLNDVAIVRHRTSHASRFMWRHTYNEYFLTQLGLSGCICLLPRSVLQPSACTNLHARSDDHSRSNVLLTVSPPLPAGVSCFSYISSHGPLPTNPFSTSFAGSPSSCLAKATNCACFQRQPFLSHSSRIAYEDLKMPSWFAHFHQLSAYTALHVFCQI